MRLRCVVGVSFVVALVGVVGVPDAAAAPSCNTFDGNNTPTNAFRGGDTIIVRGTGFTANTLVLVNLLHGGQTTQLSRVRANDLGAFAMTDAAVPADVSDGAAAIKAEDARSSATCDVTLTAGEGKDGSLGGVFLIWGIVLALFGGVLGLFTYRRWKADRLREAVDSLAWREQYEARSSDGDREPVAVGAAAWSARSPAPTMDPPAPPPRDEQRPSWVTDGPRPSWARPTDLEERSLEEPSWTRASASASDGGPGAWEPPGAGSAEEFDPDEPAYQSWDRPATPAFSSSSWQLDDEDDDLSPLGAPRPFDDRFAADDDEPPAAESRGFSLEPPPAERGDEPSAYRPAMRDESAEDASEPPFASRPAPERPAPERAGERPAMPSAPSWEPEPSPDRVEPWVARAPDTDPLDGPSRAPVFPSARAEEPIEARPAPQRPTTSTPPAPVAPSARGVAAPDAPPRDFAAALRDFLDQEEEALEGPVPAGDRMRGARPAVRLEAQDAGRIPQSQTRETPIQELWERAPGAAADPEPRRGPAAPPPRVQPVAPQAAGSRSEAPSTPQAHPVAHPIGPSDDRRLQPGQLQTQTPGRGAASSEPAEDAFDLNARPTRSAPQAPVRPSAPVRPGSDEPSGPPRAPERSAWEPEPPRAQARPDPAWEPPRRPEPPTSHEPAAREASLAPGVEPVRPGARWEPPSRPDLREPEEPPAFDPLQRPPAADRPRSPREAALTETDPTRFPEAGVSEPPVLPVGWGEGRIKPAGRTPEVDRDVPPPAPEPSRDEPPPRASDAIARLRREVKNWKR